MAFATKPLLNTWFSELDLASAGIPPERHPPRSFLCAVDDRRGILFFQLLSDSSEMRDGQYYYVLAIGRELITLTWRNGRPSIVDSRREGSYPNLSTRRRQLREIHSLAVEANEVLFAANSATGRRRALRILGPDGEPLTS